MAVGIDATGRIDDATDMCGRFGRTTQTRIFAQQLGLTGNDPNLAASYNVTPGRWLLTAADDPLDRTHLTMQSIYWGFVPSWADKPALAQINARSETAHSKPFFRKAFHRRRCVIAADYWLEWQRGSAGKQPYAIRPNNGQPFFFAGLWSVARTLPDTHPASGARTTAILTAQAVPQIAHIHQRMPMALTAEGATAWLTPGDDTADLKRRLASGRYTEFESWAVSTRVNTPGNDDESLLDRII